MGQGAGGRPGGVMGQPGFNPNGPGNPSFRPPYGPPGLPPGGGGGVMNQPGFGASIQRPPYSADPNMGGMDGGANSYGAASAGAGGNGWSPTGMRDMQSGYASSPGGGAMGPMDGGGAKPADFYPPGYTGYQGGPTTGGGLLGNPQQGGPNNNGWGQDPTTMSSTSANPVTPEQMQYIRGIQASRPGMTNRLQVRQDMHGNRGAQVDEHGNPIDPNSLMNTVQAGMQSSLSHANPNAVNPTPTPPAGGFGANVQPNTPAAPGMYWAIGPDGKPVQQPITNLSNGYKG